MSTSKARLAKINRRKLLKRFIHVAGAAALLGNAMPGWGAQPTIRVSPGESIQSGVDRAEAGMKVLVEPGKYFETVVIDKPLTLSATTGPEVTALRANPDEFLWRDMPIGDYIVGAINVQFTEDVVIEGFSVTNALEGVWLSESQHIEVRNCHSYGNTSSGFYFWACQEGILKDSTGSGNAVGVYEGQSGNITIQDSQFRLNVGGVAPHLGGSNGLEFPGLGILSGNRSAGGDIIRCECIANSEAGVQINLFDRTKVIRNCTFAFNRIGVTLGDRISQVTQNNFVGNTEYGLQSIEAVDAQNNWWGNPTGPSGVGPGAGDAVSSNVDFEPWLEAVAA